MTDDQISEIFLTNGFTIKDGLSDLKPYVYQAARALIDAAMRQCEAICIEEGLEWDSDAVVTEKNYAHECGMRIHRLRKAASDATPSQ